MRIEEFDYALPEELIAQRPLESRDAARLMYLPAGDGAPADRHVADLPDLLRPGDLVVVNDTRVFPARLIGRKPTGGRVEVLLVHRLSDNGRTEHRGREGLPEEPSGSGVQRWRALVGASRMPPTGSVFELGAGLSAKVLAPPEDGAAEIELRCSDVDGEGPPDASVEAAIERVGQVPLPPYIRRDGPPGREDGEAYQTVYAREPGAAAAPTAGLHFTENLLERLAARGIERASLTLHVGLGTFQPVRAERVEDHRMHAEFFRIPQETARAVNRARERGGRIVAVGTTVVRALEHAALPGPSGETMELFACEGWCDLFISPGFRFRRTDLLMTNFHLPRSTLLMLVCAFAGREQVLAAYARAARDGYRFYSYGDAMLIAPAGLRREGRLDR